MKNKTTLKRMWQDKCRSKGAISKKCTDKEQRVYLSGGDKEWFIEVAFLSEKMRTKLYPKNASDLASAKAGTLVFIDKASRGLGVACKSKLPMRHMGKQRCIFFQNKHRKYEFSSVPADLGAARSCGKATVRAWMRHEVQPQIDAFRRQERALACYGDYICGICNKPLGKKENHVDHGTGEKSFRGIAEAFEHKILKRQLTVEDTKNPQVGKQWRRHHKVHADLRMTCKNCNLVNK